MKKYTIIFLVFLLLGSSCKTSSDIFTNNPPFELDRVVAQKWVSGIKNGGSGTQITITFNELERSIDIIGVYYKDQWVRTINKPEFSTTYLGLFKDNSSPDKIMHENTLSEAVNTPDTETLFDLTDNEVVINYRYEGEIHYYHVMQIIQMPLLAYPGKNPNEQN